jgi:hypothetical protein
LCYTVCRHDVSLLLTAKWLEKNIMPIPFWLTQRFNLAL